MRLSIGMVYRFRIKSRLSIICILINWCKYRFDFLTIVFAFTAPAKLVTEMPYCIMDVCLDPHLILLRAPVILAILVMGKPATVSVIKCRSRLGDQI